MWAVELAIHHLDLLVGLAEQPAPRPRALELGARTLDGLLGAARRACWDRSTYLRKGTGRTTGSSS